MKHLSALPRPDDIQKKTPQAISGFLRGPLRAVKFYGLPIRHGILPLFAIPNFRQKLLGLYNRFILCRNLDMVFVSRFDHLLHRSHFILRWNFNFPSRCGLHQNLLLNGLVLSRDLNEAHNLPRRLIHFFYGSPSESPFGMSRCHQDLFLHCFVFSGNLLDLLGCR